MKNLTIDFENGSELKILTNTDIVDWQWCINKTGKDPDIDFEIACFWAGEITKRIKTNYNQFIFIFFIKKSPHLLLVFK